MTVPSDFSLPPKKRCLGCGKRKSTEGFHHRIDSSDGRASNCRACKCKVRRIWWSSLSTEHKRKLQSRKAKSNAKSRVARKFGLTLKEYENRRKNPCEICGASPDRRRQTHTDHDHNTGKLRGTLCGLCNRGLGCFGDDLALIVRAAQYLRGYQ